MSTWCAIVFSSSFGSIRASSASFPCRVEMFTELGGPSIFPSESPVARSAASLRRVPWGGFPGLDGTIRGLRLLAARPAALRSPSLGGTASCALFAPSGMGRPRGRDVVYRGRPCRTVGRRRRDLPGSWATLARMPRSRTPAEPPAPGLPGAAVVPSALVTASASATYTHFVAQSRGLQGFLCTLRSRGRPRTAQHSVPAGRPTLAGRASHPLGR